MSIQATKNNELHYKAIAKQLPGILIKSFLQFIVITIVATVHVHILASNEESYHIHLLQSMLK